jgi:SSS family transporter
MRWPDYMVLALYFVTLLCVGFRHRRQESTLEYYLAGRRMSGLLTGISVTITLLSAISYMGASSFIYANNLTLMVGVLATPLTIPVVNGIILPFYHRLPITTGYEYLERRFNLALRSLASTLFCLLRLFYLGVVIYTPSVALAVVTGWPIGTNIVLMGTVSVVLACLGGMRAVIWAEVIKFAALILSTAAILAVIAANLKGGLGAAFEIARAGGRLHAFDWSLDPTVTFATWAILIGNFFQNASTYGADQITIQRYLTSRSIDESRRAYTFCAWATLPMNVLIALVGLGIYVYYRQHPGGADSLASPDYIVPYFAVHEMPAGFSGLVIASIFSLSLTTHSSGLHSVNTAVMNDFVARLGPQKRDPRTQVRAARIGTIVWGALTTVFAFYISSLGMIIIAAKKINHFFGGALLGIFLLGMLTRRVGSAGALLGALTGITTVSLVGQFTAVSFFWYGPLGCLVTLMAGSLFGRLFPKPDEERIRGFSFEQGGAIPSLEHARRSPQNE